jgi:MFS family permease
MGLNNAGIAMVAPLFTIYHIKTLHLTNTQIAYFVVVAGIVSAISLPFVRKLMERFGANLLYKIAILGMAISVFPYGLVKSLWLLIVLQAWIGLSMAVAEVSTQTLMMRDAEKHKKEMAYFSDFQLVMHLGNTIGPLISGALLLFLPLWASFFVIVGLRLLFFVSYRLLPERRYETAEEAPDRRKLSTLGYK